MAKIDKRPNGTMIKLKKNDTAIVFENGNIHFLCCKGVTDLLEQKTESTDNPFDYLVASSVVEVMDLIEEYKGAQNG